MTSVLGFDERVGQCGRESEESILGPGNFTVGSLRGVANEVTLIDAALIGPSKGPRCHR